jgi:hypothetical protein
VCEVDDFEDAEHQRQAGGDQRIEQPEDQPVHRELRQVERIDAHDN